MASRTYGVPSQLRELNSGNLTNAGDFGRLRWPSRDGHDYLAIDIVEFQKTGDYQFQVTGAAQTSSNPTAASADSAVTSSSSVLDQIPSGTYLSNTQSKVRGRVYERITLPVPANVAYQDNPKYNE